MTSAATHVLAKQLCKLTARVRADSLSDGELVQRFTARREEEAFAALLRRHGPMVLRVCRRVLHDEHAAEDTFQATFLVLYRKASSLRRGDSLGSWLYGIASRLALKARTRIVQRQIRERQIVPRRRVDDPLAEVSLREARAILDEELSCLPEKYRAPLVLCYLEGLARDEAARRLGWPVKLIKSRLQQGRARLHSRLRRRGLTLSAALLSVLMAEEAVASVVPAELIRATVEAAQTGSGLSEQVAALVGESLKGMAMPSWKVALGVMLCMGAFTAGAGMLAQTQPAAKQIEPPVTAKASAPSKSKEQPRIDRYGDPLPPGAITRLGTVRYRTGNGVWLVSRMPGGEFFLSAAKGEEKLVVCVWRMTTGKPLHHFEINERVLNSVVLSPDGKTLATAGYDLQLKTYRVRFWNVPSGKPAGALAGIGKRVSSLAFAPDGKTIATADVDQVLRLWDCKSGTEIRRYEGTKEVWNELAFSPDGKLLASAGRRTIHLGDTATGRELRTWEGHAAPNALAFSPDGKTLATAAGEDKSIRLWEAASGGEVRQFPNEGGTSALAFSADGKLLASADAPKRDQAGRFLTVPQAVRLWDVNAGRVVRRFAGHTLGAGSLTFTADGKRLISGGWGSVLHVWDTSGGEDLLPVAEQESGIRALAFSPDGRFLAASGQDGTIRLWEPTTDRPARTFENGHPQWVHDPRGISTWIDHLAFAPDSQTLISHGEDGSVRFWDVARGREKRSRKPPEGRGSASFTYSSDGRTLALWEKDATIRILDAATGAEKRRLTGVAGERPLLRFSPDDRSLVSMNGIGGAAVIRLLDAVSGKQRRQWTLVPQGGLFAFSPDGRLLAVVNVSFLPAGSAERTFHVWDSTTGEDRSFTAAQHARVVSLAITPDNRMLVWGDAEGTIVLWDLNAAQIRRIIKGHNSPILSLAFSADSKRLASGSADTTVLIWDATGRPIGRSETLSAEHLWENLADKDAAKAFDAIGLLTESPDQAVPMLKEKLQPAPAPVDRKQIARLIADLDNELFKVRQKATEELKRLGERAEPGLREALKDKLSLESRKRVEELLESVRRLSATPERLRELRAVEVLEHIGTPEAQQVLQTLADGAPSARLTREAQASLQRIAKHP